MIYRWTQPVFWLGLSAFLVIAPTVGLSQENTAEVPLKKVVMFNAGVGYFEHAGEVEGNVSVDLKFNVDDINDLLKSMVVQDLGGGQISTVSYGSRDPITKTLQTFSVDLTKNPTMGDLLGQIRGEKVEIEAPNKITGTILGVEKRRQQIGEKEVLEIEMLNLLTDTGLRSFRFDQINGIRFLNEKLDGELRQALLVLATANNVDKKTVSLSFLGEGARTVRVGYVRETPIWKTSYRLVLEDGDATLQGWAIVENTTDEDWNNVRLSLMSGRPISFRMDLYQPLYVPRPLVVPELFASLGPKTYEQDFGGDGLVADRAKAAAAPTDEAANQRRALARRSFEQNGSLRGARFLAEDKAEKLDATMGFQTVASAGDLGELFEYEIKTPVTLQRQKSAMLPIVNGEIKVEKVAIYDPNVHQKHPLNGLKLTNSTDLHLMQGPITVFDSGAYAGDAQIADLPPKAERLISYAMDLSTEVAPNRKSHPEQLLSVRIVKGTLIAVRKQTQTQQYTIKNSGKNEKKVLIEYPITANWTLVSPKEPDEKTRNEYRFAVTTEPGKSTEFSIQEEQTLSQSVAITNLDDNTIRLYLVASVVSDKVKAALKEVVSRKQKIAQVQAQRNRLQQTIQVIEQEQNRIRQNMAQLDRQTDLYIKYVKKLTDQEDLNDKTRNEIEDLVTEEAKLKKDLDDFLIELDLT